MHIYLDSHALSGLKLILNSAAKNQQKQPFYYTWLRDE